MARQIPCKCSAMVLLNEKKQTEISLDWLFPKSNFSIKIPNLLAVFGPKRKKGTDMLKDTPCPACKGKGTVDDPTDRTKQEQAAANKANAMAKEIQEAEAKMGPPGGNQHILVVGDTMLEVGIGFNSAKSYTHKDAAQGTTLVITPEGVAQAGVEGGKQTLGTNPLATPGGHYVIKAANKMDCYVGAQGMGIHTHGPVAIAGGITKITGAEVTVGSSTGQTIIEGNHLQLAGKSVSIGATGGKGQVVINGTAAVQGNIVAQGGAHIEGDLSCISMTMPSKTVRTKVSGSATTITGAARWQTKASMQALLDFVRQVQIKIADPSQILMSPRGMQQVMELVQHLAEKTIPIETQPTGIFIGTGTGLVYNFPHHHILHDDEHTHDIKVPNINLQDDDQAVRKLATAKHEKIPVAAQKSDFWGDLIKNISSLFGVFSRKPD